MPRQLKTMTATASAVSWPLTVMDSFDVVRIDVHWASAVITPSAITVTKDSAAGVAYDTVIYSSTVAAGTTSLAIAELKGFVYGDSVVVGFANTDGISITATAVLEY